MQTRRTFFTLENTLYLAIFALALAVRLWQLGATPLTDSEAREALTVLRFVRGEASLVLPNSPAYFFFTYFSILLFGAWDLTARLAPALIGAGLVFLPAFYRKTLGAWPALLMSLLLALSAGLAAASRSADGTVMAFAGVAFGVAWFKYYLDTQAIAWLVASAIAFGIGAASGASFLMGLVILMLTVLTSFLNAEERAEMTENWNIVWENLQPQRSAVLIAFGGTVGVISTLFAMYPSGLAALVGGWGQWFSGLLMVNRPAFLIPVFLVTYEPLLLVFAIAGGVFAFMQDDRVSQWLARYALVAILVLMLYNGRSLFDLVWVIPALAALTARTLVNWLVVTRVKGEGLLSVVQIGIISALIVFALLNIGGFAEQARSNANFTQGSFVIGGVTYTIPVATYLGLAAMALAVAFVVGYLFSMGWSISATLFAATSVTSSVLFVFGLAGMWGLTQLRAGSATEVWWPAPTSVSVNTLMRVLGETSNYAVGNTHDLEVTVQADPDGALGWALRNFPQAKFVTALDGLMNSPAVIAPSTVENPALGSTYAGQAYALRETWSSDNLSDWTKYVSWLTFRRAAVQTEQIILWVRSDLQALKTVGQK